MQDIRETLSSSLGVEEESSTDESVDSFEDGKDSDYVPSDYIPSDDDSTNTVVSTKNTEETILINNGEGKQREGRVCSKCKFPLRGHPLPRGKNCQRTSISFIQERERPDVTDFYTESNRNMVTCACCGRLSASRIVQNVHLYSYVQTSNIIHGESFFLAQMFKCLQYRNVLPEELTKHYDLGLKFGRRYSKLSNIPLDHRGVVLNGSECDVILRFCNDCILSIKESKGKPPWASFANNWVTGVAPKKFQDMSAAEIKMLRLGDLSFCTMNIAGRQNGILTSHVVTRMSIYPRERLLPRDLDQCDLKVIYSNATVEDIEQLNKKWILVRKKLFTEAVEYWRTNSAAYADIPEREWNHPINGTLDSLVSNEGEDDDLLKRIWKSNDRVAGGDQIYESSIMHIDLAEEVLLSLTDPRPENVKQKLKRFLIRSKGEFSDNKDKHFFSKTFPIRFPFGYGTPNCNREVYVTHEKAFQRYLLLGDRSFAQDFELVMYFVDELARKKLHTSIYLQLKQNPGLCDEALQISTTDIEQALQLTATENYNLKHGDFDVETPNAGVEKALRIMGVVQKGAAHSFLTNEERSKMKRFSNSMCDTFGKPSGMVTWTPKDSNSSWIACFSGHLNGVNYEVVKDWKDPNFPAQKEIRRAASKDPVLSAVSFQKFVDEYVIPIYLGWDVERGCSFKNGGEIGKVKAFLIPLESQGALTSALHSHALVWLEDFPKTMKEEENNCLHNLNVSSFADKNVFGSYPLLEMFRNTNEHDVIKCPCCIDGNIHAVDIPFLCKTSLATHWPIVGQCDTCALEFTSHQLREKYMDLLTQHISTKSDISIKELYGTVEQILSADCLFPLPQPLPKYMPTAKKVEFATKLREMVMYHTLQNGSPKPILNDDDSRYVLSVIYLDIAVELTHEHRAKVSLHFIIYLYHDIYNCLCI